MISDKNLGIGKAGYEASVNVDAVCLIPVLYSLAG